MPPRVAAFYVRAWWRAVRTRDSYTLAVATRPSDAARLLALASGHTAVAELGTATAWTTIALALADGRRKVTSYDPEVRPERERYLPGFANLARDWRRVKAATAFETAGGDRFDGFALDIEATAVRDIAARNRRMLRLVGGIRVHVRGRHAVAAMIPDPILQRYWPRFPYRAVRRRVDVVLPAGADTIRGLSGRDRIFGRGGDDRIDGDEKDDTITGERGSDRIDGGSGEDVVRAGPGDDRVDGRSGKDRLTGGPGDDRLIGDTGGDRISAGSGRDVIDGGKDNDTVLAVDGRRDVIRCSTGRQDRVADRIDRVAGNCERVSRR